MSVVSPLRQAIREAVDCARGDRAVSQAIVKELVDADAALIDNSVEDLETLTHLGPSAVAALMDVLFVAGLDPERTIAALAERMDSRENPLSGRALEDSIVAAFVAAIDVMTQQEIHRWRVDHKMEGGQEP